MLRLAARTHPQRVAYLRFDRAILDRACRSCSRQPTPRRLDGGSWPGARRVTRSDLGVALPEALAAELALHRTADRAAG